MYTICSRCQGQLEKIRVIKGKLGHSCIKCKKKRTREIYYDKKVALTNKTMI